MQPVSHDALSFDSLSTLCEQNFKFSIWLVWLVFHVSSHTSISGQVWIQFLFRFSGDTRFELDRVRRSSACVLTWSSSLSLSCGTNRGMGGGAWSGFKQPSLPSLRCLQYNELVLIFLSTTAWAVTLAGCPPRLPPLSLTLPTPSSSHHLPLAF